MPIKAIFLSPMSLFKIDPPDELSARAVQTSTALYRPPFYPFSRVQPSLEFRLNE